MSSRVLRKLHGNSELPVLPVDGSDNEDTTGTGARKKQLNINRYNLLNPNSQSESEVKEDDDDNETSTKNEIKKECGRDLSKRKKKKKRRKMSQNHQVHSSEDLDEVERSVREVNALLGDAAHSTHSTKQDNKSTSSGVKSVLTIEHKYLNPKNELKRIFGSKVMQAENIKRKNRGRTHLKTYWLVQPRDWPTTIGKSGITMKMLENRNGVQYFTFEHSNSYRAVQKLFLEAVASLSPDNIVAIMNNHPYHIDTLLQLSDIFKQSEDMAVAAKLLERALYCLESSFHPLFNLASGNCRLEYKRQENRGLFITLFKHLEFVGQRACTRTALEFCKLILSLSPEEDPLAIVLTIDFYAIRSSEYEWLLKFYEELNEKRNLYSLPNFAYSMAVAHFYLDMDDADDLLQDALLLFPGVLIMLLEKCGINPDPRTQAHSFFQTALLNKPQPMVRLIQLYVARSYHIWKEKDVLPWLEKNTQIAMDRVDKKESIVTENEKKRERWYQARTPRCIERHILLSNFKEVTPSVSEDPYDSLSFDPFPPPDAINIYSRPERRRVRIENASPLAMFFSSIMPNFNINEPAEQLELPDFAEDAVGENNAAGVDLHRSVYHLIGAMRDLLSTFQLPAQDADGEDDSGSEESDN